MYKTIRQPLRTAYRLSIHNTKYNIKCNIKCNYINCSYNNYIKMIEEDLIDYNTKCISVCENCGLFLHEE